MPDHGKIGLRELRAGIHDVNEALLRVNHAIAHFLHARKIEFDVEELQSLEAKLREVYQGMVQCMEKAIGKEEKN